jgi:hypothetical protein
VIDLLVTWSDSLKWTRELRVKKKVASSDSLHAQNHCMHRVYPRESISVRKSLLHRVNFHKESEAGSARPSWLLNHTFT